MRMKMFAAVDLGANSFRMHVGVREGNAIRIVNSLSDPVSLGACFDARGCLTAAAQRSAIASLSRFGEAQRLVLVIVGGSTELVLGQVIRIVRVESFSIGTIKQSLSFFSVGGGD